jgi:hypothetical protein
MIGIGAHVDRPFSGFCLQKAAFPAPLFEPAASDPESALLPRGLEGQLMKKAAFRSSRDGISASRMHSLSARRYVARPVRPGYAIFSIL